MLAISQTPFQARTQIEEACAALQDNDTRRAINDLTLSIKSIDDLLRNLTSSTTTAGG
jgi:hypothetical protein